MSLCLNLNAGSGTRQNVQELRNAAATIATKVIQLNRPPLAKNKLCIFAICEKKKIYYVLRFALVCSL